MVTMWVTHPNSCGAIAQPRLTTQEALELMCLDFPLSSDERCLAECLIPVAVNKKNEKLFNDDVKMEEVGF
jgi:hypothetical protein